MVEIQLLLVNYFWFLKTMGGSQNLNIGHVTPTLNPFDLIYIFSVRAPCPLYAHKI